MTAPIELVDLASRLDAVLTRDAGTLTSHPLNDSAGVPRRRPVLLDEEALGSCGGKELDVSWWVSQGTGSSRVREHSFPREPIELLVPHVFAGGGVIGEFILDAEGRASELWVSTRRVQDIRFRR